ncbi:hypothetical protein FB565_001086 [Actinoplanes lutulentus]|uniref:Uncharacterized protein n=1 Tax=Actinoplanes lutulentus TaxID=1287878 RepID=A0A327ZH43_9ACTN|nr:hypothetical protein [Actinoplanes lutulentus]RAK36874.1 hypothetical protein B0I29_107136 [Actinoplanes lutulentus]
MALPGPGRAAWHCPSRAAALPEPSWGVASPEPGRGIAQAGPGHCPGRAGALPGPGHDLACPSWAMTWHCPGHGITRATALARAAALTRATVLSGLRGCPGCGIARGVAARARFGWRRLVAARLAWRRLARFPHRQRDLGGFWLLDFAIVEAGDPGQGHFRREPRVPSGGTISTILAGCGRMAGRRHLSHRTVTEGERQARVPPLSARSWRILGVLAVFWPPQVSKIRRFPPFMTAVRDQGARGTLGVGMPRAAFPETCAFVVGRTAEPHKIRAVPRNESRLGARTRRRPAEWRNSAAGRGR